MPQANWVTQQQIEEQQEDGEQTTTAAATENASGNAQGQQQQQASAEEKRFTQAELNAQIAERLQRERDSVKQKQEQAHAEAERTRLADEGKFKELNQKQAADLATLTSEKETLTTQVATLQESLKQYEAMFAQQLTAQKQALPEPVQKLLGAMPLLDQMAWMNENAGKLGLPIKALPVTPKGDNGGTGSLVDEYISALNGMGQEKK